MRSTNHCACGVRIHMRATRCPACEGLRRRKRVTKACAICGTEWITTPSKAAEKATCGRSVCLRTYRARLMLGRPCPPKAILARKAWAKRRVEMITQAKFGELSEREVRLFNEGYRRGCRAEAKRREAVHLAARRHAESIERAWAQPAGWTA